MQLSQPTISHHMAVLKKAGLIEATKQAFLVRDRIIGHPETMIERAEIYLERAKLDELASRIDRKRALPWPHVLLLRLLEVGDHPDIFQRNDRHQRLTGLDDLTRFDRFACDGSRDRSLDRRVIQLDLRCVY